MRSILYPGKTFRQYHRWTVKVMARCRVLALPMLLLGLIPSPADAAGSPVAGRRPPVGALYGTSFLLTGSIKERLEVVVGPPGMTSAELSLASVEPAPVPMRLLGGRVLVGGWVVNHRISASAELYDPSTGSWLAAGAFTNSRDSRNTAFPRIRRMLVWAGIVIPF